MPHYVYLYRDERGHPIYVGYGKSVRRANRHRIKSHNLDFADFMRLKKKFTVKVAGPFESKEVGLLVETAVISALDPQFNRAKGLPCARFRPLGVPDKFAERLSKRPLKRDDFFSVQKDSPKSVLFVIVGEKDFGDGRPGYDLANPATDKQIQERVEKWWQLSAHVRRWNKAPGESPGLLIGINGSPGSQIVIASIMIDRTSWSQVEKFSQGNGKIRVPLLQTPNLDAFKLRGRQVDCEVNLAFNSFTASQYILLNPDGTSIGGRRHRK